MKVLIISTLFFFGCTMTREECIKSAMEPTIDDMNKSTIQLNSDEAEDLCRDSYDEEQYVRE